MNKIAKYSQFLERDNLMPLNFKFVKEIKTNARNISDSFENKGYECTFNFREPFYKPLNVYIINEI